MSGGVDSSVAAAMLRRRRARRRRRHDAAVGRRERHRLLLGGRRRRRPPGRPAARHRPPRVQLRRRLRHAHVVEPYVGRPRRPGARPTRASSATGTSSSTGCCTGPTCSASTPWPPATTPASSDVDGRCRIARGADRAKDQSYVVHMLAQDAAGPHPLPGRRPAPRPRCGPWRRRSGLRTAAKPDSQDVCFITQHRWAGRRSWGGGSRSRPASSSTRGGRAVGRVDAVELVTIGQRRGLGAGRRRASLRRGRRRRRRPRSPWARRPSCSPTPSLVDRPGVGRRRRSGGPVLVQCSAHGATQPATLDGDDRALGPAAAPGGAGAERRVLRPRRRVRPRRRHRRLTGVFSI